MTETVVRTRFAPSPSGHLHVGGARTALYCWAYARKHDGRFMLRIEDTDRKRSSDAASTAFLEDLLWLGLKWDEGPQFEGCGGGAHGPYYQSERLDTYRPHIERLIESGHAYRAFETPEELDAARAAARGAKQAYRYDRAALRLDEATIESHLAEGRPCVVRFKVPRETEVLVEDEIRGAVRVAGSEIDDFVILKADGYPTYHFAVVVDDELMGVTHVLRAAEHLNNTSRHVLIQDALGFRRPVYAHLSLIMNPDGSKMSKRDKDKALRRAVNERGLSAPPMSAAGESIISAESWGWWMENSDHQLDIGAAESLARVLAIDLPEIEVDDFRRAGYLPEVLLNYLALLGWSPGHDREKFDAPFLIEHFDLDRVHKSPAKFDRDKLLAFNLDALQDMSTEEFGRRFREHVERYHPRFLEKLTDDQFQLLAESNQARSKTLEDPIRSCMFFILPDDQIVCEDSKPVRKALVNGEPNGYAHLESLLPALRELSDWTVEALEDCVRAHADAHAGGKLGKVAQPLRIAVSGGVVSPAIFDTLVILGQNAVINRIERCLAMRGTLSGAN